MQLYRHKNGKMSILKEKPFTLEKEIQTIFENNLELISGLKFVKSEFRIKEYRIDTLAYDTESNAFVIIEFKRNRNDSVIDQGFTYLNLMLDYQADFIVEYNESCKENLQRSQVDWSQSRMIFVSPSFTDYQKQSTDFKDLAIELWEIKQFEDGHISINFIKKSKSAPSIKKIQNGSDSAIEKVTKELIVYDEEDHLSHKSDEVVELYDAFKNALFNLSPELEIAPKKRYVAFKKNKKNIISILVQNKSLKIWINAKKGNLDDSKKITKDVSNLGHWATGDYEITVTDTENLEYIMSLVKQILSV